MGGTLHSSLQELEKLDPHPLAVRLTTDESGVKTIG
jgi:hypothetical protein